MDRSQMTGIAIMLGAVVEMLLFLYGAARRSYMAVALPVMGGLTVISALAFWIGWTMLTSETELEEELEESPSL